MNTLRDSLRIARDEASHIDGGPLAKATGLLRGVGQIARMRTTLAVESLVESDYTEPSEITEEHFIVGAVHKAPSEQRPESPVEKLPPTE